jgi:capsule polysaccharide export protein KpsC/LpsZ
METTTGLGHQVSADHKKMLAIKSTLEDAAMQLGSRSEHVRLQNLINQAIEEAHSIACAEEDSLDENS